MSDPIETVEREIDWYSKSATRSMIWHRVWKVAELLCAAVIPVLAVVGESRSIRLTTAAFGAFVVFSGSLQSLFRWNEKWLLWRSTAGKLMREKRLYIAGVKDYVQKETRDARLAEKMDEIIANESDAWLSAQQSKSSEKTK